MSAPEPVLMLETVHDVLAVDGLAEAMYATLDPNEQSFDEFRETFSQNAGCSTFMIARRAELVVGWAETAAPLPEERTKTTYAILAPDNLDAETYRGLVKAAAAHAGRAGLQWTIHANGVHEQVAIELGATPREILHQIWQAPRENWRPPVNLPAAAVRELSASPTDEELIRHAQFYTRVGMPYCNDNGCTTTWHANTVAEVLAERDLGQHVYVLDGPDGIHGEATTDVHDEEVVIELIQHNAPSGELAAMVARALDRVRVRYPMVQAAKACVEPSEQDTVRQGLAAAGLTMTGHAVLYHLP